MIAGEAFVRGTFWGFLIFGLSHQNLWFRRHDTQKNDVVIDSGDTRAGHVCARCGAVAINRFRRTW